MTVDDTMISDKNTCHSLSGPQQSDIRFPITSISVSSTFSPSVILISELRSNKTSQRLKSTNFKSTLMVTVCIVHLPKHSGTNRFSSSTCAARTKYAHHLPRSSQ